MAFNADAFIAALEAPTVTINGQTYVGRILSIEEWAPFADRFAAITSGDVSNSDFVTFARDYLRTVFPKKLSYRWLGDPVPALLKSPALVPTLTDFFVCQVAALNLSPQHLKTNGTDSPETR